MMSYDSNWTSIDSRPSYDTIGLLMDVKLQVMDEMSYTWIQKHKRIVGSALHLRATSHTRLKAQCKSSHWSKRWRPSKFTSH
jgi:hypothetical protein